jgi:hypothetical protein
VRGGTGAKVARKLWVEYIVKLQVPVPQHAPLPLQPAKMSSLFGVAVSVTGSPEANRALHTPGQLMPEGWLVTVPPPPTTERERG